MNDQLNHVSIELYKEVLGRGQDLEIQAGGSSMWPFIKDGETLVLRRALVYDINRGDVIATYSDQKLLCHRVFRKGRAFIQTKADALVGLDAKINYADVLGKVIAQKRNDRVHKYSGRMSDVMGKCILWLTFLWAPVIPLLRRCKAIFASKCFSVQAMDAESKTSSNELIHQLAGLGLSQTAPDRLSSKEGDEFVTAAAREGCTGLIHYNLMRYRPLHNLSKETCDCLEQEYLVNLGRNLLISRQLDEICAQFESKQLQALTVRGDVFFDQIYPELGMRPLIDMDFVVRAGDFVRARDILKELGFEHHECYPFFFFKDSIYVDLHLDSINFWRIKDWPSAIDITDQRLWLRTLPFRGKTNVRTLDRYDTVIHCCEHLMRHSFDRLIWFLDIAYLVRREDSKFQWDQLIRRAMECRAQKAVYYVFAYLNKMNYCPVPPDILWELGQVPLNFLEKKNLRLLLDDHRSNLSGDLMSLCAIEGFRKRAQALWNGVFIEEEKFPLVRKELTPFSYAARFFRLTGYVLKKMIAVFVSPSF